MRKRLALLSCVVAIAAAMALPATTFAVSGVFYRLVDSNCTRTQISAVVQFVAKASSGADYLRVRSWVEQRGNSASPWVRVHKFAPIDYHYTPDGSRHTVEVDVSYSRPVGTDARIIVFMRAYSGGVVVWGGSTHANNCKGFFPT